MIRLKTLSNPHLAQTFVDYMATQGVVIELRPSSPTIAELWLKDDNQLAQAEKELDYFLTDPTNKRYSAASWDVGRLDTPLRYSPFPYWKIVREGGGIVTHTVAVLCIAVYLLMLLSGTPAVMEWLAFPEDSSQYMQVWRWFTPALLHFSFAHILFNLVMWWYAGGMVERHLGSKKLLQITLFSALISAYAQSLFSGIYFGGLSGVVYALIGYVWLCGEMKPTLGIKLPRAMMAAIVIWFVIDHFDFLGPVGNAAHFSGLAFGLLLAVWDMQKKRPS